MPVTFKSRLVGALLLSACAAPALAQTTTTTTTEQAAAPAQPIPAQAGTSVQREPAISLLTWRALGINHRMSPDEVAVIGSAPSVKLDNVPVLFVGGATQAKPEDVAGRVLLVVGSAASPDTWLQQGARAVFVLEADGQDWAQVKTRVSGTTLGAATTPVAYGAIAWSAWSKLVEGLGESPKALLDAAAKPDFKPQTLNATITGTVTTAISVTE